MTYANVVATLALFLVLAGGTAFGVTYVVSSNSQIGPNTVSGHKPPTGKHSNIIPGTVNGSDLSANSVSSSTVTNGSLLGGDIHANTIVGSNLNLTNVSAALQLRSVRATLAPNATPVAFYNLGAFTLTGSCPVTMSSFHATIDLSTGSPAFASIDNAAGERFTGTASTPVAQTADSTLGGGTTVKGGEFSAASVQFSNHLSGHVLAVADGTAGDTEVGYCQFTFEGLGI